MTDRAIHDISARISPASAVWPGDRPFEQEWGMRLDRGDSCNVSAIRISAHCGTHVDAPLHFLDDGLPVDELPLSTYIGPCRVIAVTPEGAPPVVPARLLHRLGQGPPERLLFKTKQGHDETRFDEGFCSLGVQAAEEAVRLGLALVGLDTPSVDPFASRSLTSHKTLLRGGVAILENLDLSRVSAGDYELIALPLKIAGSDASPVRAILREP